MNEKKKEPASFHISLSYKLTFPVLIFVSLMLFLLFQTTFQLVRELVMERNERRLQAIAEVFSETIKYTVLSGNKQALASNIEWMAERPGVIDVLVQDGEGNILGRVNAAVELAEGMLDDNFLGVKNVSEDTYQVAVPIQLNAKKLGRLVILFSQLGFENELRDIFQKRLMMAFVLLALLGLMTTGLTWLAILPLFNLKKTVNKILAGDLSARASTGSFDEIADVAGAFNEMVTRLATSFDRLRFRTEALKESEEKYRLIVDGASDIIFTLTPEGEITLLNDGFFGRTREDLLKGGLPYLLSLLTEESRKKFEEIILWVKEKKESVTNIAMIHAGRPGSAEIFYLANLTPVLDFKENIKLIQVVMRDITELHRVERMKETLVRDVAHELKTPVAKFQMTLHWLEKDLHQRGVQADYAQILEILNLSADRLMRTISSIMDLSRIEAGVHRLAKKEKVDLNEIVKQAYDDMTPMIKEKEIVLERQLDSAPLWVKGDKDMLYRLFTNLISNAIHFTEEGKITLKSQKENGRIHVQVEDTGMGIDKKDLEVIFESFVQKTASTEGIGVGLTICKNIVSLHDGKIWAESGGLGKGATFTVEFPAV